MSIIKLVYIKISKILILLLALLFTVFLITDTFKVYKVTGISMYPSIKNDDTVLVYKLDSFINTLLDIEIKYQGIYTLENPTGKAPYFIKRNFGHSNENLQEISTRYIKFLSEISDEHPRIRAFKKENFETEVLSTFTLNKVTESDYDKAQKEYYFISDWPFGTDDSRFYGYFSTNEIKGQAIWVF